MTVTVYTKPACVQCDATKRALTAAGIPYRTIDLTEDAGAMARVTAWGYRTAPVVEVGQDEHWCGFRPDLIAKLKEGMG